MLVFLSCKAIQELASQLMVSTTSGLLIFYNYVFYDLCYTFRNRIKKYYNNIDKKLLKIWLFMI